MAELLAKSGDPDQTPHSAVSDLGLYYLSIILLGGLQTKMGYCNNYYRFYNALLSQRSYALKIEIVIWIVHQRLKLDTISEMSGCHTNSQQMGMLTSCYSFYVFV